MRARHILPAVELIAAVRLAGGQIMPGFVPLLLIIPVLGRWAQPASTSMAPRSRWWASPAVLWRCTVCRARIVTLRLVAAATLLLATRSSSDVRADFEHLPAILAYLFTPWTAINLKGFFVVRRRIYRPARYSIRMVSMADGSGGGFWPTQPASSRWSPLFSAGFFVGLSGCCQAMRTSGCLSACRSLDAERRAVIAADAGSDG
jgi:hypothetical protein